jgi:tetratricopeptide (TPR) repeat protein
MGRFDQSARLLTEAYPLLECAGLQKVLGLYFHQYGFLKLMIGDLADARMYYEKASSLYHNAGAEFDAFSMLINFADVSWALGDLDAAMTVYLQMVATLRKLPKSRERYLGMVLTYLAGVLTERGRFDEALAAAREGLPLAKDHGNRWIVFDLLALRAALAGKTANAARMAGFADSTFTAKQASRPPNEARARNRLHELLREKLRADELERLFAEGAKMSEDEVCQMALEE